MQTSVGENVPPDRGKPPTAFTLEQLSQICQSPGKSSMKRSATALDSPPNRPLSSKTKTTPPSASILHSFTRPGFELNSDLKYTENDSGPFIVHVSISESDPSRFSSNMRPLKIAQAIYNGKVSGIDEIKHLGRNKVSVIFNSHLDANNFLSNPILSINKLTAAIPRFLLTRMGVIRDVPTDWSMEELVQFIEPLQPCPLIIKARRLNRKKKLEDGTIWEPTGSVVLTFLGQTLPNHVYCCNMSLPVDRYSLPTIQCHKCCKFGHVRDQCRSNHRCFRCAGLHEGSSCNVPDDKITCLFCSGSHLATDFKCPEHNRQKYIKITMSEENIGYIEASRRYPPVRSSYANIASSYEPRKPVFLNKPSSLPSPRYSRPNQTQPQTLPSTFSYRKTVSIPHHPKPVPSQSYDRVAHQSIISTPSSAFPNGCALNNSSSINQPSNDSLAELMSMALVNIFPKLSEILPYNTLQMIQSIVSSLLNLHSNNGKTTPME